MLPTGEMYPPVSIGELPSHDYQVSTDTLAEKVIAHLDLNHEVPGIILIKNEKVHSMIPRARLFERLGHRFGVELFIRKPIIELQENLASKAHIISSNTRIYTAVNIALGRSANTMYDPLVMEYDDGRVCMLDMHVLLMAQSLATENMNNIVSNMNRIEHSIKADIPFDTALDMIMDAIKRTTPHHRASVMLKPSKWNRVASHHEMMIHLSDSISRHPLIKSVCDTKHPVHIEDTRANSSWRGMEFLGKTHVWIGLPIASGRNFDGVLSLSRTTNTPFSKNEIDMAKTFSEFLSVAINKTTDSHDDRQFVEMVQRKFGSGVF
jgi:hypothetical protein